MFLPTKILFFANSILLYIIIFSISTYIYNRQRNFKFLYTNISPSIMFIFFHIKNTSSNAFAKSNRTSIPSSSVLFSICILKHLIPLIPPKFLQLLYYYFLIKIATISVIFRFHIKMSSKEIIGHSTFSLNIFSISSIKVIAVTIITSTFSSSSSGK